jgi:hypothetical protein
MEKREPYEKFLKDALAALHDGKTTLNDGHVPYMYVWGGDMADLFLAKNRHYRITIKGDEVKKVRNMYNVDYDYEIYGHTHEIDGMIREAGLRLSDEWMNDAEREVIYGE